MSRRSGDPKTLRASALALEIQAVFTRLKRRLREQGHPGDLTQSQLSVLGHLDREGPATVTALAHAQGVRSQSMGATVAALESAGFVRGAPDPADGRQTIISLTESCRKLIRDGRAARQDWLLRGIQTRLSAREQDELTNALALLNRIVDPKENP
jgi:DNA-binding MarR family transcriptional regulator